MNLLEEIREYFASTQMGARKLKTLPTDFPGYVLREQIGYGVAFPYKSEKVISERFANVKMYSDWIKINGIIDKYLILECTIDTLRYEFASVCAQFLEPGIDGAKRLELESTPAVWWEQWKQLLGNSIAEKKPYSIIGEMYTLYKLLLNKTEADWAASISGSHDIECKNESYEVKSTIKRYGTTITITGQHQLETKKKLNLCFYRMEKSAEGTSINALKDKLILLGYDENKLEKELYIMGYENGTSKRDEKYKILENRLYEIDRKFPKITNESFKGDKLPDSIIRISYTIDLDGLKYTSW